MDPLSALSVVAAVVQFVDFGLKVTKEFRDIYESGSNLSQRNVDLKDFTDRARSQLESLTSVTINPVDRSSDALNKARQQCLSTGEDLVTIINKIAHSRSKSRWIQAITSGSKSMWWSTDIKRIQSQLEKQIAELNSHVLTEVHKVLRQHVDVVQENFKSLSAQQRQVAEVLLRGENNVSDLTSAIEKLSLQVGAGFSHLVSSQKEHDREERDRQLRGTLNFQELNTRQNMIRAPEEGTFDWLLEDPSIAALNSERPVLDYPLNEWLTNQERLYWICGKPGSGKSTLMNMICERRLSVTLSLLKKWSEGKEVFVASHFFWRADNSRNQVTIIGLLMTLLFRIVDEHHDLTYHLRDSPNERTTQPVWNLDRLKRALFRVLACKERPAICFIIDALDENDDDNVELLKIISHISDYERVKVCLSSRPESDFARAFVDKPYLKLEQITAIDIKTYVSGKVARIAPDRNDLTNLVEYISDNAQGVFIWVRCVIEGNISKYLTTDSEQRLLDRVLRVPKDIMKLYRQMFTEMDEDDKSDVALLFQLATLSFSDGRDSNAWISSVDLPLSALTLFESELAVPSSATTREMALNLSNQLADTLQARCFGLLELIPISAPDEWCEGEVKGLHRRLSFIHWTAATFVKQEFEVGAFLWIPDVELSSRLFLASCRLVYCRLESSQHESDSVISEGKIDYMTSKPSLERMFHWTSLISRTATANPESDCGFAQVAREISLMGSQVTISDGFLDKLAYAIMTGTTLESCYLTLFDILCIFRCDTWERFVVPENVDLSEDEMKEQLTFLLALSVLRLAEGPKQMMGWRGYRMHPDRQEQRIWMLVAHWIRLEADPNAKMIRPDGIHFIDKPTSAWEYFLTWLWGLKFSNEKYGDNDLVANTVLAFLEGGADISQCTSVRLTFESWRIDDSESDETSSDDVESEPYEPACTIFTVYSEVTAKFILSSLFGTDEQISEWLRCHGDATEAGFLVKEVAKYLPSAHGGRWDLDIESAVVRRTAFTQDQVIMLMTELPKQHSGVMHISGAMRGHLFEGEPLSQTLREITSEGEN